VLIGLHLFPLPATQKHLTTGTFKIKDYVAVPWLIIVFYHSAPFGRKTWDENFLPIITISSLS
jgi:hypothetical protein